MITQGGQLQVGLCVNEVLCSALCLSQGRTDGQCQHRWQKVLNPELVKGPWTKEEDQKVSGDGSYSNLA